MAANTTPIYGRTPDVQVGGAILGPTAVTATDGTGALQSIFQADALEGGFVDSVVIKAVGSPGATVIRLFLCVTEGPFTPGTTNQITNTSLIDEINTIAITGSNSAVTQSYAFNPRRQMTPGDRLLIGFGTSTGAAGNGFAFTTFGSKY